MGARCSRSRAKNATHQLQEYDDEWQRQNAEREAAIEPYRLRWIDLLIHAFADDSNFVDEHIRLKMDVDDPLDTQRPLAHEATVTVAEAMLALGFAMVTEMCACHPRTVEIRIAYLHPPPAHDRKRDANVDTVLRLVDTIPRPAVCKARHEKARAAYDVKIAPLVADYVQKATAMLNTEVLQRKWGWETMTNGDGSYRQLFCLDCTDVVTRWHTTGNVDEYGDHCEAISQAARQVGEKVAAQTKVPAYGSLMIRGGKCVRTERGLTHDIERVDLQIEMRIPEALKNTADGRIVPNTDPNAAFNFMLAPPPLAQEESAAASK